MIKPITILLTALTLFPLELSAQSVDMVERGRQALADGQPVEAEILIKMAISENAADAEAHLVMGQVQEIQEKLELARSSFKKALDLSDTVENPTKRNMVAQSARDGLVRIYNRSSANRKAKTEHYAAGPYGHWIQVGAFDSRAKAEKQSERILKQYAELLVNRRGDVLEKNGTFKALVGPFSNRTMSGDYCLKLKEKGGDCFPISR